MCKFSSSRMHDSGLALETVPSLHRFSWSSLVLVQPSLCFAVYALKSTVSSAGATWSARRFWLGPIQTWGLATGSSKKFWSIVLMRGRRKSALHTGHRSPRRSVHSCPPRPRGPDPPAGRCAARPAWPSPGEAALGRRSAAGSSGRGTGSLEVPRGSREPRLERMGKLKGENWF